MPRRLSIDRSAYKGKDSQVLRIAASDVAAVAGYHEWVDLRDLFLERLLYQDLEHVFRMDAANLGVEVEDKRQRAERLLAKAGDRELRKVRTRAADGAAVATVQDAQALREKARSLLKEAQAKKKISEAEAKEIENDLRYDINTQFGTRNENDAIAVYERRSGTEVICSNDRILVWPFPGDREGVGVPDGALNPPHELSEGWTKSEAARDSLKRARSTAQAADHTSAAEDASFTAAAARCLAELPALAALGRAKGVLASAPVSTKASGTDQEGPRGADDQLRTNGLGQSREEETVQGGSQGAENIGEGAGNGEMGVASGKRAGNGEGEAGNCAEEAGGNGKGEAVVASGSDVDVVPAGRRESTSVAVVGRAPEGEGCGVKSGAGAESVGPPTLPGSSAARPGETRQLAPGVPWPEWRESAPLALSGLKEAAESPVKKLATERSGPCPALSNTPAAILTPSVVPAADGAAARAAGEGWAGEPGLWFPGVLSARQRAVVETAAKELGLRHDIIGGESGGLRVVVWESLTAPPSPVPEMPSPSGPLVSPSVAAAPAAETDGTITTKRDPSCPPPPAPAKAGKYGPGGAAAATAAAKLRSGGQGDGARRTSMALAGIDTGRLDATAGAAATRPRKSARNSCFSRAAVGGSLAPAQAAATGAVPVVAGENADATASPDGSSRTASKGPAETTVEKGTSGGEGGGGSGSGHGNGGSARAQVTSVDDFGADAVYAWGEGPAAASQATEAEEGPSAGLEPSVWSRAPHEAIDATAANDSAAGLPSSRAAGADDQDEGRVLEECRSGAGRCAEEEGGDARTVAPAAMLLNSRGGGKEANAETLRERRKKACFVIAGAVDGVAEEVTDAPENGDAWQTRRVVVEVKNRMSKARHPPPLYDQIQLVTYMLMIGASVGDLVQFVKTNAGRRSSRKFTAAKPRGIGQTSKEEDVVVSRVQLDCRAYHHRKHWQESVLPRLYEFARMVYRFRGDDMLRFRYLLAGPDEQRHMLVECCPYLDGAIPRPVVHPPLRLPPPSPSPPPETGPTSPEIIVIDQESSAPTSVQADAAGETTSADVGATPSVGIKPSVVGVVEVTEITGEAVGGTGGGGGHGSVRPDRGGGEGCCEPPPTASGTRCTPSTQSECSGERGAVKVLARSPKRDGRCFQHSGLAVTAGVEAAAAAVLPLRKKTKREDDVAIGRVPFVKAQNVQ